MNKRWGFIYCTLVSLTLLLGLVNVVYAEDITPNAKSAYLIEASSNHVLYSKNEDEKLYPASMTKMMSLYLIMEAINQGNLNYTDEVAVSEHAASMGGSQIWLKPFEIMKVDDLLRSVAIASANDAVVALAEKIAVSEDNFVRLMNDKVKEWGLVNTNFMNASGLHDDNHYSTAKDMAIIASHLLEVGGADLLAYTSMYDSYIRQGTQAEVWLVNTNKLLRTLEGTDGLKTGYTSQAGYCITLTTKQNGLRLIGVVMKEPTNKVRDSEVKKLIGYGFTMYDHKVLYPTESNVGVFTDTNGKPSSSNLYVKEDVVVHYLRGNESADVATQLNLNAYTLPLSSDTCVGEMTFTSADGIKVNVPVYIRDSIEKLGYGDYWLRALSSLLC